MARPLAVIDFVVECTTTSAPNVSGRSSAGVATVLSTISGRPASWAMAATAPMSMMLSSGFDGVSPYMNRVLPSILAAHSSRSSGSQTQRTSMPRSAP